MKFRSLIRIQRCFPFGGRVRFGAERPCSRPSSQSSARSPAPRTGIPISPASGPTPLAHPSSVPPSLQGKATISDEEARKWEARENQRWEEGSKVDGGRPVTIQGGAYNVLFYDNGSELTRIGGQKRTSMVVDPPDGHVPPLVPEARDRMRRRTISPATTRAFPTTPAASSATLLPYP